MFDIGMTELMVFAVVALLILGPDKLPQAFRYVFGAINKVKSMVSKAQQDLEQYSEIAELKKMLQQTTDQLNDIKQTIDQQTTGIAETLSDIEHSTTKALTLDGHYYWYWLTGAEQQRKCPPPPFLWRYTV